MPICFSLTGFFSSAVRILTFIGFARFLSLTIKTAGPTLLVWRGCGISKTAFMDASAAAYENATGILVRLSGGGEGRPAVRLKAL